MNQKKRLFKAFLNYGFGNIISKFIGFLLIPVYTLYLNPADYGILELCSTVGIVLVTLMRMGINGSVSRFYFDFKDDIGELNNYVTTIFYTLITTSFVVGLLGTVILTLFNNELIGGVGFYPFVLVIVSTSLLSANNDLQKRLLQSKEESRYSAILNIITTVTSIGLALFFVIILKLGALGFLLSQLINAIIYCIQAQFYLKPYLNGSFQLRYLKQSFKYGVALLPHHLSAVFAPYLNRLIFVSQNSLNALGIYSLSYRFVQPLDIIYSMFSLSFSPIYFSLRKEHNKEKELTDLISTIWILMCFLYILVVSILPYVIPSLTPVRFHGAIALIHILGLSFIFQTVYNLYGLEAFYLKKVKYFSLVTILGLIISTILNFFLTKKYGVLALAYSTAANYFIWAVFSFVYNKKIAIYKFRFKVICIGLIAVFISFFTNAIIGIEHFFFRISLYLISILILISQLNFGNKLSLNLLKNK